MKTSVFLISVTRLGYQAGNRKYLYKEGVSKLFLDPIILKTESRILNELIISGKPAVTIKEDTVKYRASDYQLRENALAEDLLKKLPGIEIDKDGNIKSGGKSVTRVRVNGKDFLVVMLKLQRNSCLQILSIKFKLMTILATRQT